MDIEEALLNEHSKTQTMKIVRFVGADKNRFIKLLNVFFKGEYRITQRAAWPLSYIAIANPNLIRPHLIKLIKKLNEEGNHPAIKRNILRIFQEIEIPEKHYGILVDICFKFLLDKKQPIAIRAFAITIAAKISEGYPDLKKELLIVLNEMHKYPQQPAITARLKSAFKTLGGMNSY